MGPSENPGSDDKRNTPRRGEGERRGAQIKVFTDNQYIFREHESGQEAFIVKSGNVEIFKTSSDSGSVLETSLGILPPGTMFGEMALIDNKPRMASARAYKGEVSLMVVTQQQFNTMLQPVNPFVKKLLEILANHVRSAPTSGD